VPEKAGRDKQPIEDDKPVSFKLHPAIVAALDEISVQECRSRTGTVRIALQEYIYSHRPGPSGRKARRA